MLQSSKIAIFFLQILEHCVETGGGNCYAVEQANEQPTLYVLCSG